MSYVLTTVHLPLPHPCTNTHIRRYTQMYISVRTYTRQCLPLLHQGQCPSPGPSLCAHPELAQTPTRDGAGSSLALNHREPLGGSPSPWSKEPLRGELTRHSYARDDGGQNESIKTSIYIWWMRTLSERINEPLLRSSCVPRPVPGMVQSITYVILTLTLWSKILSSFQKQVCWGSQWKSFFSEVIWEG